MTKKNLKRVAALPRPRKGVPAPALPSPPAIIAILLGLLLTSAGYGLLLPVLSNLLTSLHPTADQNNSLHVGLVTAAYAAGALLSAPAWGLLADRSRHTTFITVSLLAGGITLLMTLTAADLATLYLWRFLAGIAAGAVSPAVQSWFSAWSPDPEWRSRYTVWTAIGLNSGFLIGPLLGGLLAAVPPAFFGYVLEVSQIPLALNGGLLIAAALVTLFIAPAPGLQNVRRPRRDSPSTLRQIAPLLINVFFAAVAVGAFEVGLSIRAAKDMNAPVETGLLLAECTIFMSAAQALLLLRFVRDLPFAPLLATSWIALFLGLLGTALTTTYFGHAISTALFGLGGGLLPPLVARLAADRSTGQIGLAAGMQTTASQGGQFLGSVGAGVISVWLLPSWTFLVASAPAIILFAAALVFPYEPRGGRPQKVRARTYINQ